MPDGPPGVPVGDLPAAAELLAEAVRSPGLEDETLARVRDERVDELALDLSQPGPRAAVAFGEAVFAAGTRYAVRDGGDVGTVAALGPGDIRGFHAARFAPSAATLVAVGDLEHTDMPALARTVFEGWSAAVSPSCPA